MIDKQILKNQLRIAKLMKKMKEDMILLAEAFASLSEELQKTAQGGQNG